jgi:LacI family transcriptional regulator
MQEQGKSFSEDLVYVAHNSYDEAYKMADAVIRSGMKGIFVTDDEMAAGLLNGLTDKGVEVPADFAIISGNDTKETLMTRPMLSTVTQPMYDVGAVSMRLLTKLMDNDEDVSEQKEILLDHGFIKRQSTR